MVNHLLRVRQVGVKSVENLQDAVKTLARWWCDGIYGKDKFCAS